jgi:hypothetical protein
MSDLFEGVSDESQGEGWWQSTDGRWYAPELHSSDTQQSADWWQASNGQWYSPIFHPNNYKPRSEPPAAQGVPSAGVQGQAVDDRTTRSSSGSMSQVGVATTQFTQAEPERILGSDVPQGPGWWKAADGRWYPAEQHPKYQPPAQPPAGLSVPRSEQQSSAPAVSTSAPPVGSAPAVSTTASGPQQGLVRKMALTTWEGIWYVLMNIALGAGYFAKVPAKKAFHDFGLVEMTSAEQFWYVLMCIAFGAGYFAKIPTARAISELPQYRSHMQANLDSLSHDSPPLQPGSA